MRKLSRLLHANTNPIGRRANDYLLPMLQSTVLSQLARIKTPLEACSRTIMDLTKAGPMKTTLNSVQVELKYAGSDCKHWSCSGLRSLAVAVNLLEDSKVIALPTDTIYGLAGLAQNNETVKRLYEIKKRDENKPLAICVGEIADIEKWAVVDQLPKDLLRTLLPGPVTLVLKRTKELNPLLNPHTENVGVRIPNSKFIRGVAKLVSGPLALTSANESNKPSTLVPREFSALWSQLGAVFHAVPSSREMGPDVDRAGSTVVDLSQKGRYKILRDGSALSSTVRILRKFKLEECDS